MTNWASHARLVCKETGKRNDGAQR